MTELDGNRRTDLALAMACANGDESALRTLDEQYLARIGATVNRIAPSDAFIDEVRQELRVHLLAPRPGGGRPRIAEYSGRGSLMEFIHVAAARLAITMKRSGGRRAAMFESLTADACGTGAANDVETTYLRERYRDELQAAFNEALQELTSRERNILRMHFIEGMPLERVAIIYNTHRTTLGRWVAQTCDQIAASARKRLGARMQLPGGAMDALVAVLRSQIDFTLSLLMSAQ